MDVKGFEEIVPLKMQADIHSYVINQKVSQLFSKEICLYRISFQILP